MQTLKWPCRLALTLCWLATSSPLRADTPAAPPVQAPVIERVEPSAGPPGTLLRISGRRLRAQTNVRIGAVPLTLELCTPNLITGRVAAGTASGAVQVETSAGVVQGPEFIVMAAAPAPSVRRVLPPRGMPGSRVTIDGQQFSSRLSQNVVLFGTTPATVRAASATQLQVIVPDMQPDVVAVMVHVLGAGLARAPLAFELLPTLAISAVTPLRAAALAHIELSGTGFDPDPRHNHLTLAGTQLRVLEASTTRLMAAVPANASSGQLRLSVDGAGSVTASDSFEVLAPPRITQVEPLAGQVGTPLVVRGTGFGSDLSALVVRLGELALTPTQLAPDAISLRLPDAAHSGKLSVQVGAYPPVQFATEIAVTEPLLLTRVQPQSGPANSTIMLVGKGFAPRVTDNHVWLADMPAKVLSATPTTLTLQLPAARSGLITLQVGATRVSSSAPFVVTNPPKISAVSGEKLPISSEFRVWGSGFGDNAALLQVTLAGQPLKVVAVRDDLLVVMTPDAAQTGELSVHVALQGAARYARPLQVLE